MCGRFTHMFTWAELVRLMRLTSVPGVELRPRYNVAPTQVAPIVRIAGDGGGLAGVLARWGLVPAWAKDPGVGSGMINARSETVETSPAYRHAFARRRCVVPISGFYEWQARAIDGSTLKRKQPMYIQPREGGILRLAGLWERWQPKDVPSEQGEKEALETFTLLTTTPNRVMREIHDRMPVILDDAGVAAWLDPEQKAEGLKRLCVPCGDDVLRFTAVSTRVNKPANDDSKCVEPVGDSGGEDDAPSERGGRRGRRGRTEGGEGRDVGEGMLGDW